MRILVFGYRALTPKALPAMELHLAAMLVREVLPPAAVVPGLDCLGEPLPDTEDFLLIHGAGPKGTRKDAVGADFLSERAAKVVMPPGRRSVRRCPPIERPGESWATAAIRRNAEMVALQPHRALCFHENPELGKGSKRTAEFLRKARIPYRVVQLKPNGMVVSVEDVGGPPRAWGSW